MHICRGMSICYLILSLSLCRSCGASAHQDGDHEFHGHLPGAVGFGPAHPPADLVAPAPRQGGRRPQRLRLPQGLPERAEEGQPPARRQDRAPEQPLLHPLLPFQEGEARRGRPVAAVALAGLTVAPAPQ